MHSFTPPLAPQATMRAMQMESASSSAFSAVASNTYSATQAASRRGLYSAPVHRSLRVQGIEGAVMEEKEETLTNSHKWYRVLEYGVTITCRKAANYKALKPSAYQPDEPIRVYRLSDDDIAVTVDVLLDRYQTKLRVADSLAPGKTLRNMTAVGELTTVLPLRALQILTYCLENGQSAEVERAFQDSTLQTLRSKYKAILTDSKEEAAPATSSSMLPSCMRASAAIGLCFTPEAVEYLHERELAALIACPIKAGVVGHTHLSSIRECNGLVLRLRAVRALRKIVQLGHQPNPRTLDAVRQLLRPYEPSKADQAQYFIQTTGQERSSGTTQPKPEAFVVKTLKNLKWTGKKETTARFETLREAVRLLLDENNEIKTRDHWLSQAIPALRTEVILPGEDDLRLSTYARINDALVTLADIATAGIGIASENAMSCLCELFNPLRAECCDMLRAYLNREVNISEGLNTDRQSLQALVHDVRRLNVDGTVTKDAAKNLLQEMLSHRSKLFKGLDFGGAICSDDLLNENQEVRLTAAHNLAAMIFEEKSTLPHESYLALCKIIQGDVTFTCPETVQLSLDIMGGALTNHVSGEAPLRYSLIDLDRSIAISLQYLFYYKDPLLPHRCSFLHAVAKVATKENLWGDATRQIFSIQRWLSSFVKFPFLKVEEHVQEKFVLAVYEGFRAVHSVAADSKSQRLVFKLCSTLLARRATEEITVMYVIDTIGVAAQSMQVPCSILANFLQKLKTDVKELRERIAEVFCEILDRWGPFGSDPNALEVLQSLEEGLSDPHARPQALRISEHLVGQDRIAVLPTLVFSLVGVLELNESPELTETAAHVLQVLCEKHKYSVPKHAFEELQHVFFNFGTLPSKAIQSITRVLKNQLSRSDAGVVAFPHLNHVAVKILVANDRSTSLLIALYKLLTVLPAISEVTTPETCANCNHFQELLQSLFRDILSPERDKGKACVGFLFHWWEAAPSDKPMTKADHKFQVVMRGLANPELSDYIFQYLARKITHLMARESFDQGSKRGLMHTVEGRAGILLEDEESKGETWMLDSKEGDTSMRDAPDLVNTSSGSEGSSAVSPHGKNLRVCQDDPPADSPKSVYSGHSDEQGFSVYDLLRYTEKKLIEDRGHQFDCCMAILKQAQSCGDLGRNSDLMALFDICNQAKTVSALLESSTEEPTVATWVKKCHLAVEQARMRLPHHSIEILARTLNGMVPVETKRLAIDTLSRLASFRLALSNSAFREVATYVQRSSKLSRPVPLHFLSAIFSNGQKCSKADADILMECITRDMQDTKALRKEDIDEKQKMWLGILESFSKFGWTLTSDCENVLNSMIDQEQDTALICDVERIINILRITLQEAPIRTCVERLKTQKPQEVSLNLVEILCAVKTNRLVGEVRQRFLLWKSTLFVARKAEALFFSTPSSDIRRTALTTLKALDSAEGYSYLREDLVLESLNNPSLRTLVLNTLLTPAAEVEAPALNAPSAILSETVLLCCVDQLLMTSQSLETVTALLQFFRRVFQNRTLSSGGSPLLRDDVFECIIRRIIAAGITNRTFATDCAALAEAICNTQQTRLPQQIQLGIRELLSPDVTKADTGASALRQLRALLRFELPIPSCTWAVVDQFLWAEEGKEVEGEIADVREHIQICLRDGLVLPWDFSLRERVLQHLLSLQPRDSEYQEDLLFTFDEVERMCGLCVNRRTEEDAAETVYAICTLQELFDFTKADLKRLVLFLDLPHLWFQLQKEVIFSCTSYDTIHLRIKFLWMLHEQSKYVGEANSMGYQMVVAIQDLAHEYHKYGGDAMVAQQVFMLVKQPFHVDGAKLFVRWCIQNNIPRNAQEWKEQFAWCWENLDQLDVSSYANLQSVLAQLWFLSGARVTSIAPFFDSFQNLLCNGWSWSAIKCMLQEPGIKLERRTESKWRQTLFVLSQFRVLPDDSRDLVVTLRKELSSERPWGQVARNWAYAHYLTPDNQEISREDLLTEFKRLNPGVNHSTAFKLLPKLNLGRESGKTKCWTVCEIQQWMSESTQRIKIPTMAETIHVLNRAINIYTSDSRFGAQPL